MAKSKSAPSPQSSLSRTLSAVCWLASSSLGCSASADIPAVVVTQKDVAFEAIPEIPGLPPGSNMLETSFDHPSGFDLPDFVDPELYPMSAVVLARGGMQDLSFLEGIEMRLASRAEGAPAPRVVARYERTTDSSVGASVRLVTTNDQNVLDYWSTEEAYYDIKVWGSLPHEAWAIDVEVAFSGQLSVSSN